LREVREEGRLFVVGMGGDHEHTPGIGEALELDG
jgi:arginase family enzyme